MAFHLCLSNSLEKLADEFYTKICIPANECKDPFAVVNTVVANGGMGTFLKRHLARQNKMGIAANIECCFLQKFIFDQMGKFFTQARQEEFKRTISFWSPEVLSWRIDVILEKEQDTFPDFTDYWAGDPMKRHLLSCELAQSFDRYQLYRSSCTVNSQRILEQWRKGNSSASQGLLYKKLCESTPDPDSFYMEFFNTDAPLAPLPERSGVFGIGTMSALHLTCLKKLAEHSDIFLFCPSPCQVYWGDTQSRQEVLKEFKHHPDPDAAAELLDDSVSRNQLLADLGVPGREFFNLLLDSECYTGEEESFYCDPAPEEKGNALHIFQSDILNARSRGEDNAVSVASEDLSLRINCCPNARRELEILHDQLLELFYGKSSKVDEGKYKVTNSLRPEDVIVMFPDINKAAPMIDAVFSSGPFKGKYAICDRSTAGQSQVIECFTRLLELPKSRCTSEEILELFEFDCLISKLGIESQHIPDIIDLVSRLRISWGLDSCEHQNFRQYDFPEFSWQDGIDRFLTEYARGEDASSIYEKFDTGGIDGESAEIFGIVAEFVMKLKEWRAELFIPRTPAEWGEFMYSWIQTFFSGGSKEYLPELSALRLAVAKIVRSAALADENKTVDPEVFISRLKSEYSLSGGKQHFLRDKITFCSLVPLRAIPAKVIAVLGLNDGEFPKKHTPKSFDLLKEIQRNDPNSANEGRYLFLEALMAAKEHLILSYVGFEDGQELAPAIPMVAVETLLKNGFGIKKEIIPLKSLEFEPLQKIILNEGKLPETSDTGTLPPLPLPDSMTLSTLHRMLVQNCDAFFNLRCGFKHDAEQRAQLLTDDPPGLSELDKATLLRAMWNMHIDKLDTKEQRKLIEKARILPVGGSCFLTEAQLLLDGTTDAVRQIYPNLMESLHGETALECSCQLNIPLQSGGYHNMTLFNRIPLQSNCLQERVRLCLRFSSDSPEKKMEFYLQHLLLNAVRAEEIEGLLLFAVREKSKEKGREKIQNKLTSLLLPPLSQEEAAARLTELISVALNTYTADKPLPLFVNASYKQCQGGDEAAVRKAFDKDAERNKVIERFYSRDDFYTDDFRDLAETVYASFINSAEEKKI